MNILVIGSGGREHAIIFGLKQSKQAGKIFALPGNGGINRDAEQVDISPEDFDAIGEFCKSNDIELVVVGPEAPLVAGIVDHLENFGLRVFGPSAGAAQLEGSKDCMKKLLKAYGVPTAEFATFTDADSAKAYVKEKGTPIVVKADGLAAGKGVVVAIKENEAITAIDEMFGGKFGDAGKRVVIEECLIGEEVSFFAICDGRTAIPFGSAQDHKRVGEGDTGPNTGGMGTYSPAPIVSDDMHNQIMHDIINPVVKGMAKDGIPYTGVLFAGIMVTEDGPKVLEFNVRFGDPEAQVIIPRLKTDLLSVMVAACDGGLKDVTATFSDTSALCVVMASKGYPAEYKKGTRINNLAATEAKKDVLVFHAGTKLENNEWLATGGRVLGVTGIGNDIMNARKKAYEAVDRIDWKNGFCRRDIGWRAVERLKEIA